MEEKVVKKKYKEIVKTLIIVLLSILLLCCVAIYIFYFRNQIKNSIIHINDLDNQLSENQNKINDLQNTNNILQEEKNKLELEKQDLENKNSELQLKIQNLEKSVSNKTTNSNKTIDSVIGSWKTTIIESNNTYITIYEFKSNGDFYINNNKVGTYKNGSILFKDSNDTNYRNASYYMSKDVLYVNLYQHEEDIWSSSDFYQCDKN